MSDYQIVIHRASSSWALFNGCDIVKAYTPYSAEEEAKQLAQAELFKLGITEYRVVYPQITSMRMTTRRQKTRPTPDRHG